MSASFSHDGAKLITASDDGTAKVWSVETGAMLSNLDVGRYDDAGVFTAKLSFDDCFALTVSEDGVTRIWSLEESANCIRSFVGERHSDTEALFSPDGLRVHELVWEPGSNLQR